MSLPLRTARHKRRALKLASTSALDDTTMIRSKVRITDHDLFGHMTNSRYNSFLEIGRTDWLIKTGMASVLKHANLNLCIQSESGQFLKALRAPAPFKVNTKLTEKSKDGLVYTGHFIRRGIVCASFETHAFLQDHTGQTVDPTSVFTEHAE